MRLTALLLATAIMLSPMVATRAAMAQNDAPARFGVRDAVLDVSISPDGKSLVILQPDGARGATAAVTRLDGNGPPQPKTILSSTGSPDRLTFCRWATGSRLICGTYMIDAVFGRNMGATRLITLNADGSDAKMLSARGNNDRALGIALGGGNVIDWLGDDKDGSVLMTRWVIPQTTVGHLIAQRGEGLAVERVNVRTLARRVVEQPNAAASRYITDGRGVVRVMAIAPTNSLGQSRDRYEYRYRKKGSRDWLPLTTVTVSNYQSTGFEPLAVDSDLDVVYGIDKVGSRTGLYKIALDGSMTKTLVFDGPPDSFGIDRLIRIGRQDRVVGASWVTDKRHVAMFDPELAAFSEKLSKALPDAPLVSIVDASGDEQRLILFAGSDKDPGRFYLYDKPGKQLTEILPVRPMLAKTALAEVKPVSYPAADGTMIPAYLTLPHGSTGKGLPAIVLPHGGPTFRDEWNFDWLPQFFANRGYAVIQPQYRGSSGYGDTWFNDNAIRSWKTAIGDVNDAGRWLVKQGIANPAALAAVGWSYGGYAALQSQVLDPSLFKAIVAIAPVVDFGRVRDEMERGGGATPEALDALFGDARTAEEGSPARHAGRFTAPVLMFMGDLDQNVPVSQGRLMASRLKEAGKAAEYIEFKGLDHQLDDSKVRAEILDRSDKFLRATLRLPAS